jgi:hypothetical protein
MEINRACRLGEIQTPIAISTYFTEPAFRRQAKRSLFQPYFPKLFHEAKRSLFQLYFYLISIQLPLIKILPN